MAVAVVEGGEDGLVEALISKLQPPGVYNLNSRAAKMIFVAGNQDGVMEKGSGSDQRIQGRCSLTRSFKPGVEHPPTQQDFNC
jgi:hypothetical protein